MELTWYVLDGMDGSGKTTIAGMLRDELESRGRSVLLIEHPNRRTHLGRLEARLLKIDGKPALVSAIALYVMDVVRSVWVLKRNRVYDDVVFVRYVMAVSYLPEGLARKAYKLFMSVLPSPDEKILVDVDEITAYGRITSRGEDLERFEDLESLRETRRRMLMLSEDGWTVIDNTGGLEDSRRMVLGCLDG